MGLLGNALSFFLGHKPTLSFFKCSKSVLSDLCSGDCICCNGATVWAKPVSGMYGVGLQAKCQMVNPTAASFIFVTNCFHDRNGQFNIY